LAPAYPLSLVVYFKPYESNGEAWRITFNRLLCALIIFQLFMTGLFLLSNLKPPVLALAMVPLLMYTLWWSWTMVRDFGGLSRYLALSSICEVQRGEGADVAAGVRGEDGVSRSQRWVETSATRDWRVECANVCDSNLNHRRYAVNDETLYVAPSDTRTDYSQPPMSNFFFGVLNTGRRRYAHPALSGSLPTPWLPAMAKARVWGDGAKERRGVVLSLRRKMAKKLLRHQRADEAEEERNGNLPEGWAREEGWGDARSGGENGRDGGLSASRLSTGSGSASNPWRDPTPPPSELGGSEGWGNGNGLRKKVSFDPGSGVIALPEGNVWDDEGSEGEGEGEGEGEAPASPVSNSQPLTWQEQGNGREERAKMSGPLMRVVDVFPSS
jgi:hypothetical protein